MRSESLSSQGIYATHNFFSVHKHCYAWFDDTKLFIRPLLLICSHIQYSYLVSLRLLVCCDINIIAEIRVFLFGNKSCAFEQMHQRTTVFFVICMRIRMYMNSACQTFDKSMSNDVVRYYCVVRPDEKFSQSQNVHTFAGGQHKVQSFNCRPYSYMDVLRLQKNQWSSKCMFLAVGII